jgi:hypothetical protein
MATLIDDADISFALVCLKTGVVLESLHAGTPIARMQDLAAAAPELFRSGAGMDLGALFTRLGSELRIDSFQEIVFMSRRTAHVVQRLTRRPDVALLAVSVDAKKLGLLLAGVRARLSALEAVAEAGA